MVKLALKDLKLFFADRKALLLSLALPIALISLFALAFGGMGKGSEAKPMQLIIADEDRTEASKSVITKLDSLKEFEVAVTTLDTAEALVKKGDESAVLLLHKGLQDSMNAGGNAPVELKYDAAKEAEIGILQGSLMGTLMGILGTKSMEKNAIAKFDRDNTMIDSATRAQIHEQISKNFAPEENKKTHASFFKSTAIVAEKENSPGLVQAVAGTAIMMLLFSVAAMGISLIEEKKEGTLKKLLYSPLNPSAILYGKMLSTNIISVFQLVVMFLFAWGVFGLDLFRNIPSLILMILATAFACSGFGMLLASIGKTVQQIQGMSTLVILVMSAIGGSMMPTFIMPEWMQKVAVVSVNYWSIQGFYDIFWRMLPVTDSTFLMRVGILFAIGLALNLISLKLFKKNVLSLT